MGDEISTESYRNYEELVRRIEIELPPKPFRKREDGGPALSTHLDLYMAPSLRTAYMLHGNSVFHYFREMNYASNHSKKLHDGVHESRIVITARMSLQELAEGFCKRCLFVDKSL